MVDMVAPPDIEAMFVSYLTEVLDHPVATKFPYDDEHRTMVQVSTTGGDVTGRVVAYYRVLIECWAPSSVDALELASRTQAHLMAWPEVRPDVYRVIPELPVSHHDVNRLELARYQFLATVYTRMVPVE